MKIRKLTIKNIASIESAELDFESGALKDAPLFLICGETGSGKTTILDCITLALYGKTPRYVGTTVKNAQEIGGFGFNDARQLVRRGATSASATLSVFGNDGKPYEATWSVDAVSRGANKGMLKGEEWSWKDCSEGGFVETKKKECEAVARRVTGLGFEQFCRTTLLAQGQFTKFLLGTEDEKAEILEKLTDTSRYSKLGIAIADKYAVLEAEARSLQLEIAQMAGLGQERANVEAKIGALTVQLEELEKKQKSLAGRLNWLTEVDRRTKEEEVARTAFLAACAGLKAAEADVAARVKELEVRLASIRQYLAENEGNAAMYEASPVILTELGYVRDARVKKAEAEDELAKHEQSLPTLRHHKSEAEKALKAAIMAADAETAKLELEETQLAALDLKQLRSDKRDAERKLGEIEKLGVRIEGQEKVLQDKANHEKLREERAGELVKKESSLPALKKAFDEACGRRDEAQETWEAENRLLENGIEALVAELKVGDECPICHNKIARLTTGQEFAALAEKLKATYAKADKAAKAAEQAYNKEVAARDGLKAALADIRKQIADDQSAIKSARDEIASVAKGLGVKEASEEGVAAARTATDAAIAELQKRIDAGEERENSVKVLAKSVQKLGKVREQAKDALGVREKACLACEAEIKKAKVAIGAEECRAEQSLRKALEKIVLPGWQEAWEADPEGMEAALDEKSKEYREWKQSQVDLQHAMKLAQNELAAMAESVKLAVELVPEAADVQADEIPEGNAARLADDARVRLAGCREACQKTHAAKPEDVQPGDSVEALTAGYAACQEEVKQVSADLGAEKMKIADDDKCANDRTAKEKVLETVRAERDEWHPIYARFGDKDGGKIRREIQSYVLANVLVKANHYLKQLSDRYGLSCEGLVLSVADAFEGGAVRPVNTLSGGEQFLVSLALALGLAGMNDTGLGVDMLLIDEGFGTLSGEHLNAAIEALERLNAITGSRKVGVISHVERLRERIRTHVEVTRNGHAPSQVRVITGNAN